MKSDFVSLVTHQLRTPLAGIKWLLELAGGEPGVSDDVRSYVQDARESADRLVGLVNDLLDVARLEQGRLKIDAQETDLGALTRSVVDELRLLADEKGHRLSVAGEDEIPAVVVDPMLLRQVVTNLLSNAIKYSPPNGSIAIRMRHDGGALEWAIQDSGIGVPKAEQGRLFEKFFRAENAATTVTDGTGLGLYLVRLIVERFGGRVWCESGEGRGARFTFTLPLASKTS
jgi:signal transduction histidine kinase